MAARDPEDGVMTLQLELGDTVAKLKRFVVFGYRKPYPESDAEDFVKSFDTYDEAVEALDALKAFHDVFLISFPQPSPGDFSWGTYLS
jgi:hypothetical protein